MLCFSSCRLAFAKIWYDIYNIKREHVVSLMLRKSSLRSTIQHRIREFEILDNDKSTTIGRIYPYSMNLEQTIFRHAVAMRSLFIILSICYFECYFFLVPKDMKIEIKATLLISALILVCFTYKICLLLKPFLLFLEIRNSLENL